MGDIWGAEELRRVSRWGVRSEYTNGQEEGEVERGGLGCGLGGNERGIVNDLVNGWGLLGWRSGLVRRLMGRG
jgi:hypothetical protein